MSPAQQNAYDTHFEQFTLPFRDNYLTMEELYNGKKNVIIEIGFGMGDATHQIAQDNPDKSYIGIEVHRPGVGKLLYQIEQNNVQNLRIIEHDAVDVLDRMIPDDSISGFHIFFPDPWPKKKHHKRRLIQSEFVSRLEKKLKSGGYLYAVTDWENYAEHIMDVLTESSLENRYKHYADSQDWRPGTNFERKGREKLHSIFEMMFIKK